MISSALLLVASAEIDEMERLSPTKERTRCFLCNYRVRTCASPLCNVCAIRLGFAPFTDEHRHRLLLRGDALDMDAVRHVSSAHTKVCQGSSSCSMPVLCGRTPFGVPVGAPVGPAGESEVPAERRCVSCDARRMVLGVIGMLPSGLCQRHGYEQAGSRELTAWALARGYAPTAVHVHLLHPMACAGNGWCAYELCERSRVDRAVLMRGLGGRERGQVVASILAAMARVPRPTRVVRGTPCSARLTPTKYSNGVYSRKMIWTPVKVPD